MLDLCVGHCGPDAFLLLGSAVEGLLFIFLLVAFADWQCCQSAFLLVALVSFVLLLLLPCAGVGRFFKQHVKNKMPPVA